MGCGASAKSYQWETQANGQIVQVQSKASLSDNIHPKLRRKPTMRVRPRIVNVEHACAVAKSMTGKRVVPRAKALDSDGMSDKKAVICVPGMASCALSRPKQGFAGWIWEGKDTVSYCSVEAVATKPRATLESLKLKVVTDKGSGIRCTASKDDKKDFLHAESVKEKPFGFDDPTGQRALLGMRHLNPTDRVRGVPVWNDLVERHDHRYRFSGFTYDWRRWGDLVYAKSLVSKFKTRVEFDVSHSTHESKKACLVGHSMGAPVILYCLAQLGDDWVKAHIDQVILVAPAHGGSPCMIPSFGYAPFLGSRIDKNGESKPNSFLPSHFAGPFMGSMGHLLGGMASTWPCMLSEMPMKVGKDAPWPDETIFARTPTKEYKIEDMGKFLNDLDDATKERAKQNVNLDRSLGPKLWNGAQEICREFKCPPVTTSIIYGAKVRTPETIVYSSEDLSAKPEEIIYKEGDDTILADGVRNIAQTWQKAGHDVKLFQCPDDVNHKGLIKTAFTLGVFPSLVDHVAPEWLEVTIVKAEDLKAADICGSSDPYVVCTVMRPTAQDPDEYSPVCIGGSTDVKRMTLDAEWNCTLPNIYGIEEDQGDVLVFEVWDADIVNLDDSLGESGFLHVSDLMPGENHCTFQLFDKQDNQTEQRLTVKVNRCSVKEERMRGQSPLQGA